MAIPLINPTGLSHGFTPGFGWRNIGTAEPYFNTSGFLATVTNEITRIMREEANNVRDELENATATWQTPVDFDLHIDRSGDTFTVSVWTDNEIFRFVNDGTSVRYATMTSNFIPKTSPGKLWSFHGRGGAAYINRKIPRPGIEARNFVDTAFNKIFKIATFRLEDKFEEILDRFWDDALSR